MKKESDLSIAISEESEDTITDAILNEIPEEVKTRPDVGLMLEVANTVVENAHGTLVM